MRLTDLALAAAIALVSTLAPTLAAAQPVNAASGPISPERMSADVKALADKSLAGRAPGGPGEAGTIAYITGQMKAAERARTFSASRSRPDLRRRSLATASCIQPCTSGWTCAASVRTTS